MTPPRVVPDPRRWPHPITALRRWAQDFRHLNRSGQLSALYYPLRRLIIAPAPDAARCYMGAPVGDHVWCPRPAEDGSPWCKRHRDGAELSSLRSELRAARDELHRLRDRYPTQLHDGRCLRRCCADLDDQAFTTAFRRVTGEGE